jgi:DNA polymerase-3 subunit delta
MLYSKEIDQTTIQKLVPNSLENDIWGFLDALFSKNSKEAIKIMRKLFEMQIEPLFILAMLARQIKITADIHYLFKKGSNDKEIIKATHLAPFIYAKAKGFAKNTSSTRIQYLMSKIVGLDFSIKKNNLDPEIGLLLLASSIIDSTDQNAYNL